MAILASQELIRAIQRYKAGDQAAFEFIYNGSVQYITKCVLTVLNRTAPGASEDILQDIIQDTYLTVATKLDTLQSEELFLQWAGRIATNHALRTWEKDTRRREQEQSEDEMLYELPDERFIPEDILYHSEKQQMIRNMLQELPTGQYLCLVEYFYNGLKETEVAQKLGMPLGTVKTNLSRAKKKLKEIVQTHEKKSGVKLYNMSWLLLLLWRNVPVSVSAVRRQATLRTVMQRIPKTSVPAATAKAGGSAAKAGRTVVTTTKAGGAAVTVAAKTGIPLAAKVVAAVLAAATVVGGAAAVILPEKEERAAVVSEESEYEPEQEEQPETAPEMNGETVPEETINEALRNQVGLFSDPIAYNGHYYMILSNFDNWEEVLQYGQLTGGYPATITSYGENAVLQELFAGILIPVNVYTGLYMDPQNSQWQWVTGESVEYTNWATDMPTDTQQHKMCYHFLPEEGADNSIWCQGTFSGDDDYGLVIFEFETLPDFLQDREIPVYDPIEAPDPNAGIHLTDEAKSRMEQILRYVAYADSGAIHTYVGQGWDEYEAGVESTRQAFLEVTQPAGDNWDKCEVLLLMGWNEDPSLACSYTANFIGDSWEGGIYYSESRADEVITNLLGDLDTSWLDCNIISQGYTTELSDGCIYQPATHLFNEDYGNLHVTNIEELGNGEVAIHAVYERDYVLDCVYTARENPSSIIGYTLTGVSYQYAEASDGQ